MSKSLPGRGDSSTWGRRTNHPHDPRGCNDCAAEFCRCDYEADQSLLRESNAMSTMTTANLQSLAIRHDDRANHLAEIAGLIDKILSCKPEEMERELDIGLTGRLRELAKDCNTASMFLGMRADQYRVRIRRQQDNDALAPLYAALRLVAPKV